MEANEQKEQPRKNGTPYPELPLQRWRCNRYTINVHYEIESVE